jgi:N-carbamoyl-L-amino-acid hydrolase
MRSSAALAEAESLAARLFARLATETADAPGITRVAYGEGERAAFRIVAEAAADWGAQQAFDAAGNQFLTLPGRDRSRQILIGSHLDSVPHGGNYDGAAGVLLGIVLQAVLAATEPPPFDLTVVCLRAEESCWFPHSYIGSKTALGRLDPAVLETVQRSDSGLSLAEHMRREGFDPEAVRRGERHIEPGRILAFIEPHIEQAPLLVAEGMPLGIVTGIRGSIRHRTIRIDGEYAHSGAMPRRLRRDAVVAAARFVTAMQDLWLRHELAGDDLAVTFGEFMTNPAQHSFSKVAGEVQLCLDVRSLSEDVLATVQTACAALAGRVGEENGVAFDLGPLSGSAPALMSDRLIGLMGDAATELGLQPLRMPSGAGHDAATFSQAGIPTGMLFIRNENGSHNPLEAMEMADFRQALEVLHAMLLMPVGRWLDWQDGDE